ncbi:MAG TPA: hypothetical protein VGH28_13210 [Polyangiaceae bacterium]
MRASLALALLLAPASALAEPTARDCIDANERSIQLRDAHDLGGARTALLACASPSCPADVREECERRLALVTAEIPTVVFAAKDPRGRDQVAVRVLVDGVVAAESLDGTPVSLDPGSHTFRFEERGEPPVETIALVREGEKNRPIRVVIGTPPPLVVVMPRARRNPTFRLAGVATAALGLVAVAAGSVLGLLANDAWSRARSECVSSNDCPNPALALSDRDASLGLALGSTVAFMGGGLALAAGGVLFFAAPVIKPGRASTAGLMVEARF